MNISYDYYRIFYYIAKYKSISKAAEELLANQSNLSRTLKNLELQLGCSLFLRTHTGMKLTKEGEKLFSHVRVAFEHIELGESEITRRNNPDCGSIFIAASEVALRCLMLPVLKCFRQKHPGVHIKISNHSTPQAIDALKDGTADIAVVTTPTPQVPSLSVTEIKQICEVAVCPPSFSALTGKKVPLAEITDYPLISLGSDTKSFEFYSDFFSSHGCSYRPDIETSTADQVLPIVEAGLGVGFVPAEFIHSSDGVRIIDLAEKIPMRSVCMIKRKEQVMSAAAKELERMILSC